MKRKMTLLLVLVFAVFLTACSNTGSSDDTPAPGGSVPVVEPPDVSAADLSELEAMIASASQLPEFTLEEEIVDAKAIMTGKRVMMIPSNSSNPFATGGCELVCSLLEAVGAEGFVWENAGMPDEWNAGVQNAINQKYDFVSLYGGIDPGLVSASYALLQEANIPLMTAHFGAAGTDISTADWRVGMDFERAGQLMAAWTVLKGGTDVKVAVLCEYDTESGPIIVEAMRGIYEQYAPNATVEFITVPINDWATKCQNETQNAIMRIQGLDYVVPIYDSMLQYVVPGIEMAGKTGEVKTISYNGTPFTLDMVREGSVEMVVGESLDWIAYATVDTIIRAFDGNTEPIDEQVPHLIFTQENVETCGIPAEYGKGYGDAYIAGYETLWGLK